MFRGTLRFNFDPEDKYTNDEIMRLIAEAGLTAVVQRDEKGLLQEISEHGSNLSSGEK